MGAFEDCPKRHFPALLFGLMPCVANCSEEKRAERRTCACVLTRRQGQKEREGEGQKKRKGDAVGFGARYATLRGRIVSCVRICGHVCCRCRCVDLYGYEPRGWDERF